MNWQEFSGKSIKEAIARACEELNVDEALLEVEVIEESSKGFLGIVGQRDAKVKVRKRDVLQEVMATDPQPVASVDEEALESSSLLGVEEQEQASAQSEEEELPAEQAPDVTPFMDGARKVLEDILQRMQVEAEVDSSTLNGSVYLDIKGDRSGLLIGKKGQTLEALQFIVNRIVNKTGEFDQKVDVIVDTENYRERKRESLREIALKVSEKAKKTHKPVPLEPMPSSERRIIHLILADDKDVYTKSYGEGPMRRLIVYPRKALTSKRRRR